MRVTLCVDALEPQLGGIGRYTRELCRGLARHGDISELRYVGRNTLIHDPETLVAGSFVHPRHRWPLSALNVRQLNRALRSSVVHGPNYFLPAGADTGVITVHDLSVFRYPETHPAERVTDFERRFQTALDRASHIITDTDQVRTELIETYSVRPEMVTAIHLGVQPDFRPLHPATSGADKLRRLGLQAGSYGLSVSALEPRKKISELLRAWRGLPPALRNRFPLVLAGGQGWRNESLRAEIEQGVGEGWLRHLGFVAEADLPALYAGAALFVYPSIYEGFGLPPLEAMASGVPVIVSGSSCLPEVCGDAARYVNPDDIDGFGAALQGCLSDEQWRGMAASAGQTRAQQFTWERCVNNTVGVYRKLAAET